MNTEIASEIKTYVQSFLTLKKGNTKIFEFKGKSGGIAFIYDDFTVIEFLTTQHGKVIIVQFLGKKYPLNPNLLYTVREIRQMFVASLSGKNIVPKAQIGNEITLLLFVD